MMRYGNLKHESWQWQSTTPNRAWAWESLWRTVFREMWSSKALLNGVYVCCYVYMLFFIGTVCHMCFCVSCWRDIHILYTQIYPTIKTSQELPERGWTDSPSGGSWHWVYRILYIYLYIYIIDVYECSPFDMCLFFCSFDFFDQHRVYLYVIVAARGQNCEPAMSKIRLVVEIWWRIPPLALACPRSTWCSCLVDPDLPVSILMHASLGQVGCKWDHLNRATALKWFSGDEPSSENEQWR